MSLWIIWLRSYILDMACHTEIFIKDRRTSLQYRGITTYNPWNYENDYLKLCNNPSIKGKKVLMADMQYDYMTLWTYYKYLSFIMNKNTACMA